MDSPFLEPRHLFAFLQFTCVRLRKLRPRPHLRALLLRLHYGRVAAQVAMVMSDGLCINYQYGWIHCGSVGAS
jgi:hypothetical protein